MSEKESAAFVCEVSHDEVEGQWFKGEVKLRAGENIKIRQEGEFAGTTHQQEFLIPFTIIYWSNIYNPVLIHHLSYSN